MKRQTQRRNVPLDSIAGELGSGRKAVDISNDLASMLNLPDIPTLPSEHSLGIADLPEVLDSTLSEQTRCNVSPYTQEIFNRLAKQEESPSIALDLSLRIHLRPEEVLKYILWLQAHAFRTAAEFSLQASDPDIKPQNLRDVVMEFVWIGREDTMSDEVQPIFDKHRHINVPSAVQQKCVECTERIRAHTFLIEEVSVRSGLLSGDSRHCEQRGENFGKLLVYQELLTQVQIRPKNGNVKCYRLGRLND